MSRCILVTGCSSGIGYAMAREFHRQGHIVYATARRPETLASLAAEGLRTLALDVTDDESLAQAMAVVAREQGRLDVLVNNAGFSQVGAITDLTRSDLQKQYDTNVIAPVAVTRAALPLLRAAVAHKDSGGRAVLVNIGSIVGILTTPFAGAYCSSKAALHSLSDALRMELAPFGIKVVTVQPGGVKSSFGDHAEAALRLPDDSIFKSVEKNVHARAQAGQVGATTAEEFVVPIVAAILSNDPPIVIRGGHNSFMLPLLKRWLPVRLFDAKMSKIFGLDLLKSNLKGESS